MQGGQDGYLRGPLQRGEAQHLLAVPGQRDEGLAAALPGAGAGDLRLEPGGSLHEVDIGMQRAAGERRGLA